MWREPYRISPQLAVIVQACLSVVVMELQLVRNELHRQNDEGRVSNTLNYGSWKRRNTNFAQGRSTLLPDNSSLQGSNHS